MNLKRTATIAAVGGALAAWLAGAATSNRSTPAPIVTPRAPIEARGEQLASEIARLQERLRPDATPHQPGRNLFAFHSAPTTPVLPPRQQERNRQSEQTAIVEPPAVAQPSLKLAGIAEDEGPDGAPVRTAIISGEGQLFMVKEGENVSPRYRVAKISADVVELIDLATNTPRRLALR
jgi:hypothetical protein